MDTHTNERPVGTSFSHTRRMAMQMCPRKYYLQYVEGIEPLEIPKPLRMGSAFSDALEHADPTKATQYYTDLMADPATPRWAFESMRQEMVITETLAQTYLTARASEQGTWMREMAFGPVYIEGVELAGHSDEPLYDNGRLDGIRFEHADGTPLAEGEVPTQSNPDHYLHILENKLKGMFGPQQVASLPYNPQLVAYVARAIEMFMWPLERTRVSYDVSIKPANRKGKNESPDEFITRLRSVLYEKAEGAHQRHQVEMIPSVVAEYQTGLIELAIDQRRRLATNNWPEHRFACDNYGGCPLLAICNAGDDVESVINTKFKRVARG